MSLSEACRARNVSGLAKSAIEREFKDVADLEDWLRHTTWAEREAHFQRTRNCGPTTRAEVMDFLRWFETAGHDA